MKVTIIVPVYNTEPYIVRCFESIANQTYTNIECLFVDDCTPDNSVGIIEQLMAQYSGSVVFRIVKHEVNRGLSAARNSGTLAASGKYIYYLDSDDEITTDCIEVLVGMARKYADAEIIQGNTKTIPEPKASDDWANLHYKDFPEYSEDVGWIKRRCLLEPKIPINAWNKLIEREFVLRHGLFFKEGIIHEDDHWMFYVAKHLKSIAFVREFGYLHYRVDGSIMRTGCNARSLKSALEIVKDWNDNLDNYLLSAQKSAMYVLLRNKLLIVNRDAGKEGVGEIRDEYRVFIKELLRLNMKSGNYAYCLILLLMLAPKGVYNTVAVKKAIGGGILRVMVNG